LGGWRSVPSVAGLRVAITVISLVSTTVVIHLSCPGHVGPHCEITEGLRILFRSLAMALVVVLVVVASMILVLVMVLIIAIIIPAVVMVRIVGIRVIISSVLPS
jgi:hypothetical protein